MTKNGTTVKPKYDAKHAGKWATARHAVDAVGAMKSMNPAGAHDPNPNEGKVQSESMSVLAGILRLEKKSPFMIDPRTSRFIPIWDNLMGIALVFTALMTPFEISFIPPNDDPRSGFWIINRILDSIFLFDMLLQFNVMVYEESSGRMLGIRRQVTAIYLRGWFWLDMPSLLPSSVDYVPLFQSAEQRKAASSNSSTVRVFRIIRVVRLLKLLRLLRSSRIIARVLSRVAIPFKTLTMAKLAFGVLIAAHWLACLLGMICTFSDFQKLDTWQASFGFCWPVEAMEIDADGFWIDDMTVVTSWVRTRNDTEEVGEPMYVKAECAHFMEVYMSALEWALMLISGANVEPTIGPFPPLQQMADRLQRHEVAARTFCVILGALIWTYVTAAFVEVVVNTDPDATEFRNRMDDLNRYIKAVRLPGEIAQRLRGGFCLYVCARDSDLKREMDEVQYSKIELSNLAFLLSLT